MREVGVREAKTHLSALLDSVERGGEAVVITRNGKPVARLSPAEVDGEPPKRSGKDLVAEFERLRRRIASENPETGALTREDLKQMARE